MKNLNRPYRSLLTAPMIILVTWPVWANVTSSGKFSSPGSMKIGQQSKSPSDPCWFMTLKDKSITYEMIKERQDRDMHGYPTQIPLSEAIRIFNEEKQCVSSLASYPALTEGELIGAIVAGPDNGKQGEVWRAQKDALWKIASRKVMPKGSLLVADASLRIQDSPLRPSGTIEAKGIRITLLLGLQNYKHGALLNPEQTLVIRKTYTNVEAVR